VEVARQDLEASLDLARQTGNQYYVARALMNLGRLWLAHEDWAQAAGPLAESERLFAEMEARDTQVDALLLQSEMFVGQGNGLQANARLEQAQRLLADAGQTENDQQGRLLRQRGMIALSAGQLAVARQELKASLELFHKLGDRFEQAKTCYQLARWARQAADTPQAHEYSLIAQQTFEALGARLEADRCQALLKALA
jgi:tetratricopeptide (TPR) repeat protein